jgi:hypothetical protein
MSSDVKPIFLLAETGFVMRNLLLGTFADEMIRDRPLVVAVRNPDDPRLQEVVAGRPIRLVPYLLAPVPKIRTRLDQLKNWQSLMYRFKVAEKGTDGARNQMRSEDGNHSWIGRIGTKVIYETGHLLSTTGLMGKVDSYFLKRLGNAPITQQWRDIIADIDPAAVVSTTLTLCTRNMYSHDLPAVLAAKALGVPCGTLVQSWDNLSMKTAVLPVDLDRYWTWSDVMTGELTALYPRIRPESAVVVGSPQFDFHRPEVAEDRETFMRRLGLDPARPMIMFGTGTPTRFPHEPLQVVEIVRALRAEDPDLQFVVRLHPKDAGLRWQTLEQERAELGIVLQHTAPPVPMDLGGFVPSREFYREQVSALVHSAVVVNSSSTISVDAAILDRPVVCLAYDVVPDPRFPEGFSWACTQNTHFAPLVATGGMAVVRSVRECVDAIRCYVADPSVHRDGRKEIVRIVAGKPDGNAGKRLASNVAELVRARP